MYWDLKPNNSPFVIATVYIPPSTSVDTFIKVEHEIDDEDKEFYIVGDLIVICLIPTTKKLNSIIELYQLYIIISQVHD